LQQLKMLNGEVGTAEMQYFAFTMQLFERIGNL
jgi:hypothetical protein